MPAWSSGDGYILAHGPHSGNDADVSSAFPRWRYQWSIDVYAGECLTALAPAGSGARPALTARDVTDIRASAVADPFLLQVDNLWHLFFEVVNAETNRGEIAHATSQDGRTWRYDAVVLREPFHLSYPLVFEHDGRVFMVPETRQAGAVRLYEAEAFPARWRLVATLLEGPYADATLFERDGGWWMFAQRGLDELCLFRSDAPDRGWTPHPASPLFAGNRSRTRPGGRILTDGGRLIRLAQDGWPKYGHSLRAFEILDLSSDTYEEREIEGSPILRATRHGWNAAGMHHLDALRGRDGRWTALVDGAALVPA